MAILEKPLPDTQTTAVADLKTKAPTGDVTATKKSWKGKFNKNAARTFTFKLVSASAGDPGQCPVGGIVGGQKRALQRVIPPNSLRKNRYAKQLPRALLETFTPEDFGIHTNLDEGLRRRLCDEIYGDAADLLAKSQQKAALKQLTDTVQQGNTSAAAQETSRPSSPRSSDLDDDCYFPKDGYDYTQHLVPIRGRVYNTTKKLHAVVVKSSTTQSQEQKTPQDALENSTASAGAWCREEGHVLEALENADDYEDLLDDFVAAAQTDETGHVQPIEGEEALLWGESHTARAERQCEALCEHMGALHLQESGGRELIEEEGEQWTDYSDIERSQDSDTGDASPEKVGEKDGGGMRTGRAPVIAMKGAKTHGAGGLAAAPADEDFEKVLEKYADEYIGEVELDDEESDGSEGDEEKKLDSEVEEALDDFLRQHKRGKKLQIFTKDFLLRKGTGRSPLQAEDAARVAGGVQPSRSNLQSLQQRRCIYESRRSSSGNDEEETKAHGTASDSAGNEAVEERLQAEDCEPPQHEQRVHKIYPHEKQAPETEVQDMFRPLSAAEVQIIKRLAVQQEHEMKRGEEGVSTDEEMREEQARREEERRWDCETILTTRSASSWAPRTIALPPPHILKKQLHLLRAGGTDRGSDAQDDVLRILGLLPQAVPTADDGAGRRHTSYEGGNMLQRDDTALQQISKKTRQPSRATSAFAGGAACADDAEGNDSTSGSSSEENAIPRANTASDTSRLVESLQRVSAPDIRCVAARRPRGETTMERRERKKAIKATQRFARELKKQNKLLLKEEGKKAADLRMKANAYDLQAGVRCVKL